MMDESRKRELVQAAMKMLPAAYVPYSHFHVGAALLGADGRIYTGCNIENASYPATVCAERVALGNAVSSGCREFTAIAVCGGSEGNASSFCTPCGVCRQMLREFVDPDSFLVILGRADGSTREFTLEALLPESFGPANLGVSDVKRAGKIRSGSEKRHEND